ncbi:MAG TPA: 4-hydroxy-tetrahydrodipicolinate synthase [Candidatus Limnocylindria bacterium]|nr:4-hydroxy-tetrahydrodipicolinate synthase [Candidatus Limnocylindria bacterium]
MWHGCLTALITPFRPGGDVDYDALAKLVDAQVAAGIDGLVPCGSTGEAATLTHEEHGQVVRAVVEMARRRVPVIAGTGSNSTAEAVRLTQEAERAGADGALLISPYYNRPPQEGIFRHYETVAASTRLPLLIYNIPGRTGSNVLPETILRLARIPNIVGVKEASGSMAQVQEILAACGPDFAVLSGDDNMTLPIMAAGGTGVIAVTSNLVPERMVALTAASRAGRLDEARKLARALLPLMQALMSLDMNPIPIKTALAMRGQCHEEFRLPLVPMAAAARERLRGVLEAHGLG